MELDSFFGFTSFSHTNKTAENRNGMKSFPFEKTFLKNAMFSQEKN